MYIPKEHRIATFSYIFKEGVLVVKKDVRSNTHPQIEGPTNLEVIMLMKSLQSRDYLRVTFSWQHYYCYLTDKGIEYLRSYLALPMEIVPATHKKLAGNSGRPEGMMRGGDRGDRGERGDKFGDGGGGRPNFRDRGERGEGGGDREYRGRGEGGGGRGGGGRGGGFGRGGGGGRGGGM